MNSTGLSLWLEQASCSQVEVGMVPHAHLPTRCPVGPIGSQNLLTPEGGFRFQTSIEMRLLFCSRTRPSVHPGSQSQVKQ
jgi:hypothetical protein